MCIYSANLIIWGIAYILIIYLQSIYTIWYLLKDIELNIGSVDIDDILIPMELRYLTRRELPEKFCADLGTGVLYPPEKALYRGEFPISLLKTAFQIIEAESPENPIIDDALAQIYEEDTDFVVEWLHRSLHESNGAWPVGIMLNHTIQSTDFSPVIQMLEREIDRQIFPLFYKESLN